MPALRREPRGFSIVTNFGLLDEFTLTDPKLSDLGRTVRVTATGVMVAVGVGVRVGVRVGVADCVGVAATVGVSVEVAVGEAV